MAILERLRILLRDWLCAPSAAEVEAERQYKLDIAAIRAEIFGGPPNA